jgi:hypothetical protein
MNPAAAARPSKPNERGQASVELAMTIPLVVFLVLGAVQVGLIVAEQVAVIHAAREGARAAAVSAAPSVDATTAARGATSLRPIGVDVRADESYVTVTVTRTAPTDVPFVGALMGDVELRATVTMRWEP